MPLERKTIHKAIDRKTARSVGKLVIAALSFLFVLYLATMLPAMDWLFPGTTITFVIIARAIATVVIAAVLLWLAGRLAVFTRLLFGGPAEVIEHLASAVHWLAVLAAVIVLHRGFEPIMASLIDGSLWAYDLVFLGLAIPPLVIVAARLYVALDPAAELFAEKIATE